MNEGKKSIYVRVVGTALAVLVVAAIVGALVKLNLWLWGGC